MTTNATTACVVKHAAMSSTARRDVVTSRVMSGDRSQWHKREFDLHAAKERSNQHAGRGQARGQRPNRQDKAPSGNRWARADGGNDVDDRTEDGRGRLRA